MGWKPIKYDFFSEICLMGLNHNHERTSMVNKCVINEAIKLFSRRILTKSFIDFP